MRSWFLPLALGIALAVSGSFAIHTLARAQGAASVIPLDAGLEFAVNTGIAVAPAPDVDPGGFFLEALRSVRSGNGWMIASVVVVALTWLLRILLAASAGFLSRIKLGFLLWLNTDRGGVLRTAIVATLGGLAHAFAAGVPPGWPFLLEVVQVWLTAIGLYVAGRRALVPKDNVKFPKEP